MNLTYNSQNNTYLQGLYRDCGVPKSVSPRIEYGQPLIFRHDFSSVITLSPESEEESYNIDTPDSLYIVHLYALTITRTNISTISTSHSFLGLIAS